MKTITILLSFIATTLFFILFNMKQIRVEAEKQTEILQQRTKNDSLYSDHLSHCAFVSSEQLTTDKNGYLILKK
jgi:hypothetical protein